MHSAFLKLTSNDLVRGAVVAILSAAFTALAQQFNAPGFDMGQFDWQLVAQVSFGALIGYLSKNLATTRDGKILGTL